MQEFEVLNVKCGGCAKTLQKGLSESFGTVEVDLSSEPRKIRLDIEKSQIPKLREALKKMGYPLSDEKLSAFESVSTTAKSYVSCAIGKMS